MTDRERFIQTFAHLHASEETLTEVLRMTRQEEKKSIFYATRRVATLALAAALLLGMGVTAFALGKSIHKRRQQEVREQYQVEENHVSGYMEFETPEETEAGVTLLAAYNAGEGVRVYVNVSPVSEEEVRTPFYQTPTGDGRLYYLSYIARVDGIENPQLAMPAVGSGWEYAPEDMVEEVDENGNHLRRPAEEAQRRRWREEAYDSETQTLTLSFSVSLERLMGAEKFTVQLVSYDNYVPEDEEARFVVSDEEAVHRDFGSVTVPVPAPEVVEFTIPKPICFTNPNDEGELRLLGGRITATGFGWIMQFDGMQSILGKSDAEDADERRAHYEHQVGWINFIDKCVEDAYLVLSDGTTQPFSGSTGYTWLDNERIMNSSGWAGTIDVHKVVAVCVAGQTIALPGE